jgi:hypothetical protein
MGTRSIKSFSRSQGNIYYNSNFGSSGLLQALLHGDRFLRLCHERSVVSRRRRKKASSGCILSKNISAVEINYEIHDKELLAILDSF